MREEPNGVRQDVNSQGAIRGTVVTEKVVRWELEACGRVQKVGYRDSVEEVAHKLGLVGTVRNDEKDRHLVHVVAQGPEDKLSTLIREISGKHGDAVVEDVRKVAEKDPDPRLTEFIVVRGPELKETLERADESVLILRGVRDGMYSLGDGMRALGEGMRALGGKMDAGFNLLGEKIDAGNKTLGEKIDAGNKSLGEKMDHVAKVVEAGNQRAVKFEHDLAFSVTTMDSKYGMISKTLQRMEKALEKQTKATDRQTAAILRLATQVAKTSSRNARPSRTKR